MLDKTVTTPVVELADLAHCGEVDLRVVMAFGDLSFDVLIFAHLPGLVCCFPVVRM